MSPRQTAQSDAAVEAAIAQVLAAERSARDAVAQARADAAAITDESRQRARAIGQRTERRMQRVRAAYENAAQTSVARIAATTAAIDDHEPATPADQDRLAACVSALAAKLTGGSP